MDEGEIIKQLREQNEQLRRENELLKAKMRELEARLARYENAHTGSSLFGRGSCASHRNPTFFSGSSVRSVILRFYSVNPRGFLFTAFTGIFLRNAFYRHPLDTHFLLNRSILIVLR